MLMSYLWLRVLRRLARRMLRLDPPPAVTIRWPTRRSAQGCRTACAAQPRGELALPPARGGLRRWPTALNPLVLDLTGSSGPAGKSFRSESESAQFCERVVGLELDPTELGRFPPAQNDVRALHPCRWALESELWCLPPLTRFVTNPIFFVAPARFYEVRTGRSTRP
jgi:hypothetical protein